MSVIIKMKGLPFDSTAKDIKSFFQGLHLREDEIHLAAYKDGKAAGIAFAVFHSDEDARKAMFRNGKYMGKRYIELFLSSTSEMSSMLQHGVPIKTRQSRDGGGGRHDEMKPKGDQKQSIAQKTDRRDPHPRARSRSPLSRHGNPGRESGSRNSGGWNRGSGFSDSERLFEFDNRGASSLEMRWRGEEDDGQDRYHRLHNEREIPRESMGNRSFQVDEREIPRERMGNRSFQVDEREIPRERMGNRSFQVNEMEIPRERIGNRSFQVDEREIPRERMGNRSFQVDEREIPRERMGNRSFQVNERQMHRERGHGKEDNHGRSSQRRSPQSSREDRGDRSDFTCCKLNGLPFQVSESDIRDFLEGFSVRKIKLLYHAGGSFAGKKNGQAYVELRSAREAQEAAKKKHKQYLKKRYVEVVCCSKKEMIEESNLNDDECRRAQEGQRGDRESRYDSMASGNPISDLAIKINPEILHSAYGMPNLLQSPDLRTLGLSLSNPYMPSEAMNLQTLATLKQLESRANINPEDVTAGCVVGIRNLPSTITADEILDFFYGFPVYSDSVRIHYLAPGRSSGDAMVTFRSSQEAMAAIEQLNHKPVGKRNIQLFLV